MNRPQPLITVGIPTHNRRALLREAVESVRKQSLYQSEPDAVEIVIVDDASDDATPEVGRALAAADPRIRYLRNEENMGQARCWRRIAESARARYIKYLHDDDLFFPDCLDAFATAARAYPSATLLACLSVPFFRSDDILIPPPMLYAPPALIPGRTMLRYLLAWTNMIGCPTNVMYRAETLRQVMGVWETTANTVHIQDFAPMVRVLEHGDFFCINRALVAVRVHAQQMTSATTARQKWEQQRVAVFDVARALGQTELLVREAEMQSARQAVPLGFGALYSGQFSDAFFLLRRWWDSPERGRALRLAMAMNLKSALPFQRQRTAIKRMVLRQRPRVGREPARQFRFRGMEQTWRELGVL
jgi:hypothetical protein